jgi:hypothetical protein
MHLCQISELWIYPVKSLAGISLSRAVLSKKGFEGDRRWMLVNPKGQFVTQRQLPQLALIKTELTQEGLRLSHPDHDSEVWVSWQRTSTDEPFSAVIWQDKVRVLDEGDAISRWLSEVAKSPYPIRLVRMADDFTRSIDQSSKLGSEAAPIITEFADGFPYLITNQQSLQRLNQSLLEPMSMRRFRPNIVITGLAPFAEHSVEFLKNEAVTFAFQFPCERCIVTTIDPISAVKHPQQEPLHSLKQLNPMPGSPNGVAFGENASLVKGEGFEITVGEKFQVIEKGSLNLP